MKGLARDLRTLIRMGHKARLLLVEATLWLALARVALVLFPFRSVAARLGEACAPATAAARMDQAPRDAQHIESARSVGWAVSLMARKVPFKAVCLQQAVAAKMMLRRRGIASALHLGVARGGHNLDAHAWLDTGRTRVTGYPVDERFTEILCFV